MSNAYLSPILQDCQFNDDGTFLAAGLIWFYEAGTTMPLLAYTGPDASVAWTNPIVLNARGETGGEIWLKAATAYKIIIETPPEYGQTNGVVISTFDNITGVNDPGTSTLQNWLAFGGTPTYVSATSFTVAGDQRGIFLKSRRIKSTNTSGTVYSTIVSSSFATGTTTVVVSNDYGQSLDSGLSAISYGFIETGPISSIPIPVLAGSAASGAQNQMWIDYDSTVGLRWAVNNGALSSNWPINAATATAAASNTFSTQQTATQGIINVRHTGVNDVSLVNDTTGWGLLQQSVGYAVQYTVSTGQYSYGGFTLPAPLSSKYIKFPNGLIIQFGQGSATSGGATVAFPTAFPNLCVTVCVSAVSATTIASCANNLSTTAFTAVAASSTPVSYIAFGY